MKTTSLYDIERAKQEIEKLEGLPEEEFKEYWQALNVQEGNKIDNTVKYIREAENFAESCEREIARLEELRKFYRNRVDRIKKGVKYSMEAFNVQRIETGFTKVYLRNSESVDIFSTEEIPQEFKKVKTTETIDKKAIKEAIKEGKEVCGARVVHNQSIIIT